MIEGFVLSLFFLILIFLGYMTLRLSERGNTDGALVIGILFVIGLYYFSVFCLAVLAG